MEFPVKTQQGEGRESEGAGRESEAYLELSELEGSSEMQDPDPTSKETEVSNRDGLALPKGNMTSRGLGGELSQILPNTPARHHVRVSLSYSREN